MRSLVMLAIIAAPLALDLPSTTTRAQETGLPLKLTSFAVNMSTTGGNVGRGPQVIDIQIDRWSTDQERQNLLQTFLQKGSEKLLDTLQDMKKVGFMRLPTSLGYDLQYARKNPDGNGGEQIVIATDRYIGFWEASRQPRTIDYSFTLIDIRINAKGEGQGKLSLATKLTHNKKTNTIEIENWSSEPVRLNNVHIQK